jgi:Ca2+-binding EF-hand superfamily protein
MSDLRSILITLNAVSLLAQAVFILDSKSSPVSIRVVVTSELTNLTKRMGKTDKQLQELRELFNTFDADGSGSVTAGELALVLAEMGIKVSQERLNAMIAEVDGTNNFTNCSHLHHLT